MNAWLYERTVAETSADRVDIQSTTEKPTQGVVNCFNPTFWFWSAQWEQRACAQGRFSLPPPIHPWNTLSRNHLLPREAEVVWTHALTILRQDLGVKASAWFCTSRWTWIPSRRREWELTTVSILLVEQEATILWWISFSYGSVG